MPEAAHDETAKLPQRLEKAAESALDWCETVLGLPIDVDNSALLRAQGSAAQTALNTQIRADALRLRAARQDKALQALLKLIHEKQETVPPRVELVDVQTKESCVQPQGLLDAYSVGPAV